MNLLGRLFIVLIFIGSVMFMSISIALYATHTNWRENAMILEKEKVDLTKKLADLQKVKSAMETALNLEINIRANQNVALKERINQLIQDDKDLRDDLDQKNEQLKQQTVLADSAITEMEKLRERYTVANEALLTANNDWMNMCTKLIQLTDEAHALAIQVTNYETISSKLAKDYQDAVKVLISLGVNSIDPELYVSQPPAGIKGIVTEVRQGGVIEISIGADSGLIKGHHLDIIRQREGRSSYIAKIEIINVVADRSIAKVMPNLNRGGVVQRGDEVTYIDVNELVAH